MGKLKKAGAIAALLAIIVVAGVWVARRQFAKPKPPPSVLGGQVALIDEKSLEEITKTLGEWEKLGQRNGRYKNPTTGAYTMAEKLMCASCGEIIASPFPPGDVTKVVPREKAREIIRSFKCPKCGKPALPQPPAPPPFSKKP